MKSKTKQEIIVITSGLNQLGVDEVNEYYKPNIEKYGIDIFSLSKLGDYGVFKKRFKNVKYFYKVGLDNYLFNHECPQSNEDGIGYGPRFSFQLKHFDYKVYEVNITETYDEVTL
jgi:hypothetical protein